MSFRIPDERISKNEKAWRNREFLEWAYRERGLSPRTIAYQFGVSKSHVTVFLERHGIIRPWRHEPTLYRLYVVQGLSAEEMAARDEFECSSVTVRKWLARFDLIESDPDDITYNRLDDLGSENRRVPEKA